MGVENQTTSLPLNNPVKSEKISKLDPFKYWFVVSVTSVSYVNYTS